MLRKIVLCGMLALAVSISQGQTLIEVVREDPRPLIFFLSGVAAGNIAFAVAKRKDKKRQDEQTSDADRKEEDDCDTTDD